MRSLLTLAPLLLAAGVVLPPGSRLHLEPDAGSRSLTVVDMSIEVATLEERDGWIRVAYDGYQGWVRPGAPVPLDEARAHLAGGGRGIVLERWRLLTDVEDEALLVRIQELAMSAPARFQGWWKIPISTASGPAIVLFSDPEGARAVDSPACGRVRRGVATATLVEGDPDATIRSVLHQVGHLYASFDLLGPTAPPWLEEGLHTDLETLERGLLAFREPAPGRLRSPWRLIGASAGR